MMKSPRFSKARNAGPSRRIRVLALAVVLGSLAGCTNLQIWGPGVPRPDFGEEGEASRPAPPLDDDARVDYVVDCTLCEIRYTNRDGELTTVGRRPGEWSHSERIPYNRGTATLIVRPSNESQRVRVARISIDGMVRADATLPVVGTSETVEMRVPLRVVVTGRGG